VTSLLAILRTGLAVGVLPMLCVNLWLHQGAPDQQGIDLAAAAVMVIMSITFNVASLAARGLE